ncbi:hypothetical protein D3C72_1617220 [compost metagenome]
MWNSSTTRPGRAAIMTTRLERNTASWMECVTKMTVSFFLRHRSSRSASSLWRVISSSAPKGSSISSRSGCVTRPRAIDTRICMPPDSARGSAVANLDRPTSASASVTRASASARGKPARSSGRRTLVCTLAQGMSVGDWKTNAIFLPLSSSCATGLRHRCRRPSVGSSRPATIFSSVLLPHPEGPSSVTNSPSSMVRSTGSRAWVPLG